MVRPVIEVVHVGSASRDLTTDDPRGWRLGGGATYAALTTARLGLRTAAFIGVDAAAAEADELDRLREAGVDLRLVRLDEGPVFENRETAGGRVQTCHVVGPLARRARRSGVVARRSGLVARAGGRRGRRRLGGGHPGGGVRRRSAGRGCSATSSRAGR